MTCDELPQLGCCGTSEPPGIFRIALNPIDMFPRQFWSGTAAERLEMFFRARRAICRLPFPEVSGDVAYYTWNYGDDAPVFRRLNGGSSFDTSTEIGGGAAIPGQITAAATITYMAPGRTEGEHRFSFGRMKLTGNATFAHPGVPIKVGDRFLIPENTETTSVSKVVPLDDDVTLVSWRYVTPSDGFVLELAPPPPQRAWAEVSYLVPSLHQAYWGPMS